MRLSKITAAAAIIAASVAIPAGTASASDLSTGPDATSVASQQQHWYEPAVMNAAPSKVMPGAKITFDGAVATHGGKPLGHITKIASYGFAAGSHPAIVTHNHSLDFTATATASQTPGTYTAYLYTSDHPNNAAATASFKVVSPAPAPTATINVNPTGAANGQKVTINGTLPTGTSRSGMFAVTSPAFAGKGATSMKVKTDGTYKATATVSNTPGQYKVSLLCNGKQLVSTPFTIVVLGGSSAS
ncbi:hypothetical protein K4749_36750 [Streptomyces sp. TRM72054]|uniref:hypothetical protein n=1 Tax=Streptomyces sp. TRM72054 TaxID=2870562 RepID=UPI001C8C3986|nr:hypothetical protein [Streptomyces sp. TRM72054]MBX9398987.1 hypothetical protein [Streptomyces sp. TRM72054]